MLTYLEAGYKQRRVMEIEQSNSLTIKVKHQRKVYIIDTEKDADIEELQAIIYSLTMVNPSKQKLMYKGKILKAGSTLSHFKIKKSVVNMLLMGTPDDKVTPL